MRAAAIPPLLLLLILLASSSPALGQATSGNVGVLNVPPSFRGMDIGQSNGHYTVKVIAADSNGWRDILDVLVEVIDESGAPRSAFTFRQYNGSHGDRIDEFRDVSGGWLVKSASSVRRPAAGDLFTVRCTLNLTFTFTPGDGARLRLTVTDRDGLNATALVPYKWGEVRLPEQLRSPYASLSISGAVASSFTAFVLRGRWASDSLARSIERKRRKKPPATLEEMMQRIEDAG